MAHHAAVCGLRHMGLLMYAMAHHAAVCGLRHVALRPLVEVGVLERGRRQLCRVPAREKGRMILSAIGPEQKRAERCRKGQKDAEKGRNQSCIVGCNPLFRIENPSTSMNDI
jgi:hypothetical protein